MQPHDINKTISYLSSNTFLPHDIKDWKEDKLRDYLSKTEKKKDYFEKWIIKHHEKLRDPKYRRQQEALYKLHSRLKTKVELIETIISKDSAHA